MISNCAFVFAECGSVVNNSTLTSPGYPKHHPRNMDCNWTWEIPSGKILNVTFASFDMEPLWDCG